MFTNGVAYASVFSAALTFIVVSSYLPGWVAALAAVGVFFVITRDYDDDRGVTL